MARRLGGRLSSETLPRGTLNESRWDEVVRAAADVFSEKGYRGATLQDVASRLGMLKGSLYYYIQSKEDLLFEIMRRAHEQGVVFVTEPVSVVSAAPPERLEWIIRSWMAGVASLPSELAVAENDLGHISGERRRQLGMMRQQIARVPQEIIAAGIAQGLFDPSVDPYVATATMFRLLNSTRQWHRSGGAVDWEGVTDWYVQLMLHGMSRPDAVGMGDRVG
jgi:AcrR family transcriptional regulator